MGGQYHEYFHDISSWLASSATKFIQVSIPKWVGKLPGSKAIASDKGEIIGLGSGRASGSRANEKMAFVRAGQVLGRMDWAIK
jgi:hypothetical protein